MQAKTTFWCQVKMDILSNSVNNIITQKELRKILSQNYRVPHDMHNWVIDKMITLRILQRIDKFKLVIVRPIKVKSTI